MEASLSTVFYHATYLAARATVAATEATTATTTTAAATSTAAAHQVVRPPSYKIVGIILAVCSGLFIGVSFVLKKVGLLKANVKYHEEAGEGYGYLKNWYWWAGMTLMILGEICNFVAYAFTDAILVTPLGALSVVITTILSAIFLKERLSFVGKMGCFICIVGSIIIPLNAPEQSAVADIQEMQHYVITAGFLSYTGVIILGCVFTAFWVGPRYGKKSMMVYLSICSLIGGLSVVCTQGLGAAILAQINGEPQFNKWFTYVLLVFVVCTLLTEIIYLNKALNLFNAALVTPTYYVYFTSSTIVASAVLFQGFHGTAIQIMDVILGFLVICCGVILLQLSKSAKDVPDAAVFKGDLDQVRTVAEQAEPEYEPRADTIRGGAGIVRAISKVRSMRQADEMKRLHEEYMEPIGEHEQVEWDGLRRRRTISSAGNSHSGSIIRRKSVHPPLGMSSFPDDVSEPDSEVHPGFFGRIGRKSTSRRASRRIGHSPVPLSKIDASPTRTESSFANLSMSKDGFHEDTSYRPLGAAGPHVQWVGDATTGRERAESGASRLQPPLPPPHGSGNKRQFSFHNVFHRRRDEQVDDRPDSRSNLSFVGRHSSREYPAGGSATEEERLGLVHGDSSRPILQKHSRADDDDDENDDDNDDKSRRDSDEWNVPSGMSSSPEHVALSHGDLADIGRQQRQHYDEDAEDMMYETPMRDSLDQHPGRR